MATPPPDVTDLLSAQDLARMRKGYSRADMNRVSHAAFATRYREAEEIAGPILARFYERDPPALDVKSRELILIGLLAVVGDPMTLSVHFYWALGEKVDPRTIAETLVLIGGYAGIHHLANALFTMKEAFGLFKAVLDATPAGGAPATPVVIEALLKKFRPAADPPRRARR